MLLTLPLIIGLQSKWQPPYQAVEPPVQVEKYASQVREGDGKVILDGDLLTLVAKGKENPMSVLNRFPTPMKQVGGTDVWIGQARFKDWDKAFFSYSILRDGKTEPHRFRGPRAPRFPSEAKMLKGSVTSYTLTSKDLDGDRTVDVYVPPTANVDLPVVVMADGQSCKEFATVAEPLILAKKVRPFVILGVYHGDYTGPKDSYDFSKDFRAREYLKLADPDRFAAHLRFVCDQVLPWARDKFHVSSRREDTAVFGFSNGGAFALIAALERPDVFGGSMPSSVAAYDPKDLESLAEKGRGTKFFFVAGELELFSRNTRQAVDTVKPRVANCTLDTYYSCHDEGMWMLGFAKDIQKVFPIQKR
ncbi:MAG: hypothetical protein GC165_11160 [Armatimonadetes bacterium]|nr:hypothetical protein [Armatimonadota bacterium]